MKAKLPDLPKIPQRGVEKDTKIPPAAKVVVAGTYVAEQTSKTSFELVNASYREFQQSQSHRPVTSNRRGRLPRQEGPVKYTMLPALQSIDPLLSNPAKDASLETAEPGSSSSLQIPGSSSARVPFSAQHFDSTQKSGTSSARVNGSTKLSTNTLKPPKKAFEDPPQFNTEGDQTIPSIWRAEKSDAASAAPSSARHQSQMSDIEAMEYLTRPPTGKPQQRPKEIEEEMKVWQRVASSRKGKRIHSDQRALFEHALQGTDFTVGLGVQRPTCVPNLSPGIRKGPRMSDLTIKVLPENAVSAFFENEAAQERNQKNVDKLKKSLPKALPKRSREDRARDRELSSPKEPQSRKGRSRKDVNGWDQVLDAVLVEVKAEETAEVQKLTPVRREGCEALRLLVFGYVGNEECKTQKEKDAVFAQSIGTQNQVKTLYGLWQRLDDDNSGRVDFREFHTYVSKIGQARLAEKAMVSLLGKKSSFGIEDMMKLLWPCTTPNEVKQMKAWGIESIQCVESSRVKTPPVLPKEEFDGLCQNFRWFDADNSGTVSIHELVESGLLDKEQATRYLKEWDQDGTGDFTCLEFCQMLCPSGYRANEESKVGTDKNGNRVMFDEATYHWVDCERIEVTDV